MLSHTRTNTSMHNSNSHIKLRRAYYNEIFATPSPIVICIQIKIYCNYKTEKKFSFRKLSPTHTYISANFPCERQIFDPHKQRTPHNIFPGGAFFLSAYTQLLKYIVGPYLGPLFINIHTYNLPFSVLLAAEQLFFRIFR